MNLSDMTEEERRKLDKGLVMGVDVQIEEVDVRDEEKRVGGKV